MCIANNILTSQVTIILPSLEAKGCQARERGHQLQRFEYTPIHSRSSPLPTLRLGLGDRIFQPLCSLGLGPQVLG